MGKFAAFDIKFTRIGFEALPAKLDIKRHLPSILDNEIHFSGVVIRFAILTHNEASISYASI